MKSLCLKLFGGFHVCDAAGQKITITGTKSALLLAYLALKPGKAYSREQLIGLFWSDRGDSQARGSLRQTLWLLGKGLKKIEPCPLIVQRESVAIDPATVQVDATTLETLVAEGTPDALQSAVVLYRGELLEGIRIRDPVFEDFLRNERARLHELAVDACTQLLDYQLQAGLTDQAVLTAKRLLEIDPLHEAAHRALMQQYASKGQISLAIKQYQHCCEVFRRELNVNPGAETERLFDRIRFAHTGAESSTSGPDETVREHYEDRTNQPFLQGNPSIAVLPFDNMSGDPEQEFFADGMAEEIITALSHYRWFFVIARNSSFTYKNRAVDVKQVAQELGARYVLEGSVRKAGNRVRVTAQLIDASTGIDIWAQHYDRELDDIFALQDEITETIVGSIEPELGAIERSRARRKPPDNLDAWDSFQRGLWHAFDDVTPTALPEAKRWFKRACELDPDFAVAYAELAYTYVAEIIRGQTDDQEANLEKAYRAAEKAVGLDPRDPIARCAFGRVYIFRRAFDKAIAEMEAAISLNPSFDRAYYGLGLALLYGGKPDESVEQFETAIRLSPRSPIRWAYLNMLGRAYFNMEKFEEALKWFEKSIQQPNTTYMPFIDAAATLGHLDRIEEARALFARGEKRKPNFSVDTIKSTIGMHGRYLEADRIIDGLRKAGLPE